MSRKSDAKLAHEMARTALQAEGLATDTLNIPVFDLLRIETGLIHAARFLAGKVPENGYPASAAEAWAEANFVLGMVQDALKEYRK